MDDGFKNRYNSSAIPHLLCVYFLFSQSDIYYDSQLEKAKELVRAAIHAGIMSDLGSGNNIDICVITKQGVDYIRPYQEAQYKDNRYSM